MKIVTIRKLRRYLHSHTPIIGGWLRRLAARMLARAPSPKAIAALAEVVGCDDAKVRRIALEAISAIADQADVDAVCGVWVSTRDPLLEAILVERRWAASTPPKVKVLSALKAGLGDKLTGAEIVPSLVTACLDQDPAIAEGARLIVSKLKARATRRALSNELCLRWAETRSPVFEELMVRGGHVAEQSLRVRVLSALKIKPSLLAEAGAEAVEYLLLACEDRDSAVADQARLTLGQLKNREAREEVCRLFIERDDAAARQAALEGDYTPHDEHRRALFFFLTGQWERYESLDFDLRLLRAVYESADAALRSRITEKLRATGRTDFLTVVAGSDYRARAAVMTKDEAQFIMQMFESKKEWAKLFALALDLSFEWSARIIGILSRNRWKPDAQDERAVFEELVQLASTEMVMTGEEISRHLPPAVARAHARVRGRVNDIAFSPLSQVIAIGTGARKVVLWNYHRGANERLLDQFDHSVGRVVFTGDGSLLVAERTNTDGACAIYCFRDGRVFKLGEHLGSVTAMEAAGASQVLTAGRDHRAALWDVETGRKVAERTLNDWARSARVSFDGQRAALLHGGAEILNLPHMSVEASSWGWGGVARCGAFAPDDKSLIVGKFSGEVLVCRRDENTLRPERAALASHSGQAQGVETLAERRAVITAGSDGSVRFTSWATRALIGSLHVAGDRLTSLRVSPDGAFMVTGDSDASISLWDLRVLDVPMMFARPFVRAVPIDLAAIDAAASQADLHPSVHRALRFMECILRHRFRYEIEIDEVPAIQAGEFDIEIEG